MEFSVILVIAVIALTVWIIITYNNLQSYKQVIVEQSSNMQVSLQKRRDLASRVLDVAKGFGDHEKLTHLTVSSNANASTESLAALSQSFPELKANQTYVQLMKQLEELETNISNKRESYNRAVKNYNTYRSSFPTMLVVGKLRFEAAPYYDAENEDALSHLATFTRDAVKDLISASSESLKHSATSLKKSATSKLDEAKKSEIVKSAVQQSTVGVHKAVNIVKAASASTGEKD
jgi:LemA protein